MQIATEDTVYVFDIHQLGDLAFHAGLRQILDSDKPLKVCSFFPVFSGYHGIGSFHSYMWFLVSVGFNWSYERLSAEAIFIVELLYPSISVPILGNFCRWNIFLSFER